MMVPRSYLRPTVPVASEQERARRGNSRSPVPSRSPSPKSRPPLMTIRDPSPQPRVLSSRQVAKTGHSLLAGQGAERAVTEPAKLPSSQPMIIPARKVSVQSLSTKSVHGRRVSTRPDDVHDPHALPPAMAALLAITEIPPPKGRTIRKKRPVPTRVSIEHLRGEWKKDASNPSSLSKASPLDFLLQPAEDPPKNRDLPAEEADKESRSLSSRSVSSDSIRSTPSLYTGENTISPWSTPTSPTPSMLRRPPRFDRKERVVSSPPAEECVDHPLLECSESDQDVFPLSPPTASLPVRPRPEKLRSSFKSNLTASFQALRRTAKSFSNFTAPSILSDDMLTRSLFSSYASEMRPKFTNDGIPDPILRRYLNPQPALSNPDLANQLQDALGAREAPALRADGKAAPMIMLTTYSSRAAGPARNSSKRRASSAPPPDDRVQLIADGMPPTTRQREPRENSDFLRVIVLEMNMRRVGKLDAKAGGRARIWLPPRRTGADMAAAAVGPSDAALGEDGLGRSKVVPMRWVGVSAEDVDLVECV